jgi:hypothetical protein
VDNQNRMNEELKQILADLKEINEMNKKTLEILTEVKTDLEDFIEHSL